MKEKKLLTEGNAGDDYMPEVGEDKMEEEKD